MKPLRAPDFCALALAFVASCEPQYAIWLEPTTAGSTPVFGIAKKHHGSQLAPLSWFTVSTCEAVDSNLGFHKREIVWAVKGWDLPDSARMLGSVGYGRVPQDFDVVVAAKTLVPGCYIARVSARDKKDGAVTGELYFWIDPSFALQPWTRAQDDSAEVAFRQSAVQAKANYDSVFAKCSRAYKAARTSADTSEVERATWGDTLRFGAVTCGEMRAEYLHWTGKAM